MDIVSSGLKAHDQRGDFAKALTSPRTLIWPVIAAHPVNMLVNANISAAPFAEILIRSLDAALEPGELEMVVRALTQKGLTAATDRLLKFFSDDATEPNPHFLWAVGNAVHTIAPRDHLQQIIAICRNKTFGSSRGQLVLHLSRFKKTEEVFQTLMSLLEDESVKGQALEALWRYGDTRAIPAIEATPVREGLYEAKAKTTAPRRLNRKRTAAIAFIASAIAWWNA